MGKAMFYHLTRQPLEVTLPILLEKSLAAGWRVSLRGTDPARLEWLDERLWLGAKDSFLPHGMAGGPHDADQPVLLGTGAVIANGAACLMAIDGAEVAPAEVAELERVCILFDGQDEAALTHARAQWKALTAAGVVAEYWSEDTGSWACKARSGA